MLKAINIKWDTDGDKEVLNELPTEVTIPENTEEEDVCDYLSDEYGYCVFGFDVVQLKDSEVCLLMEHVADMLLNSAMKQ